MAKKLKLKLTKGGKIKLTKAAKIKLTKAGTGKPTFKAEKASKGLFRTPSPRPADAPAAEPAADEGSQGMLPPLIDDD